MYTYLKCHILMKINSVRVQHGSSGSHLAVGLAHVFHRYEDIDTVFLLRMPTGK